MQQFVYTSVIALIVSFYFRVLLASRVDTLRYSSTFRPVRAIPRPFVHHCLLFSRQPGCSGSELAGRSVSSAGRSPVNRIQLYKFVPKRLSSGAYITARGELARCVRSFGRRRLLAIKTADGRSCMTEFCYGTFVRSTLIDPTVLHC